MPTRLSEVNVSISKASGSFSTPDDQAQMVLDSVPTLLPDGNSTALAREAQSAAAVANATQKAADAATSQARSFAATARAATGAKQSVNAGIATVQHLARTRDAFQLGAQAIKQKAVATSLVQAAKLQKSVEDHEAAAAKYRSAGHYDKADAEQSKANVERNKVGQLRRGAHAFATQPVKVAIPPELSDAHLTEVGAKFNLRVKRKDAAARGDYKAMAGSLRAFGDANDFDMRNPAIPGIFSGQRRGQYTENLAGLASTYGGGQVGRALAAAELGNVGELHGALGELRGFLDDAFNSVANAIGVNPSDVTSVFNSVNNLFGGNSSPQGPGVALNPTIVPATGLPTAQQQFASSGGINPVYLMVGGFGALAVLLIGLKS